MSKLVVYGNIAPGAKLRVIPRLQGVEYNR